MFSKVGTIILRTAGVIAYPVTLAMLIVVGTAAKALTHTSRTIANYAGQKIKRAFAITATCALQVAGYDDIKEQLRQHYREKSGCPAYMGNSVGRAKLKYVPRRKRNRCGEVIVNVVFAVANTLWEYIEKKSGRIGNK